MIGLLRLEAGEFDHLSPLLGFLGDKLGEVGDRAEEKFLEWMSTEPRTWLVRNGSSDRMLILIREINRQMSKFQPTLPGTPTRPTTVEKSSRANTTALIWNWEGRLSEESA